MERVRSSSRDLPGEASRTPIKYLNNNDDTFIPNCNDCQGDVTEVVRNSGSLPTSIPALRDENGDSRRYEDVFFHESSTFNLEISSTPPLPNDGSISGGIQNINIGDADAFHATNEFLGATVASPDDDKSADSRLGVEPDGISDDAVNGAVGNDAVGDFIDTDFERRESGRGFLISDYEFFRRSNENLEEGDVDVTENETRSTGAEGGRSTRDTRCREEFRPGDVKDDSEFESTSPPVRSPRLSPEPRAAVARFSSYLPTLAVAENLEPYDVRSYPEVRFPESEVRARSPSAHPRLLAFDDDVGFVEEAVGRSSSTSAPTLKAPMGFVSDSPTAHLADASTEAASWTLTSHLESPPRPFHFQNDITYFIDDAAPNHDSTDGAAFRESPSLQGFTDETPSRGRLSSSNQEAALDNMTQTSVADDDCGLPQGFSRVIEDRSTNGHPLLDLRIESLLPLKRRSYSEEHIYEDVDLPSSRQHQYGNSKLMTDHHNGYSPIAWLDETTLPKVMLWSEYDAYVLQMKQCGASACGQTAVFNVLQYFDVKVSNMNINDAICVQLRDETAPIPKYLFSRSKAGTSADDIIKGVCSMSGGQIVGKFFHFYPERQVDLAIWLSGWMQKGAVPVFTLNLQKAVPFGCQVPDAWHHQMVYGIDHKGVYLTNPLEIVPFETVLEQLTSDPTLLVRSNDVIKRWNKSTDLSPLLLGPHDSTKDRGRWRSMNVLGQVINVIRESVHAAKFSSTAMSPSSPFAPSSGRSSSVAPTTHVKIPAIYKSGVAIFVRRDSAAHKRLTYCAELPLKHENLRE